MRKVSRVLRSINAGLVVFTEGHFAWVFSEPDKDGLRKVYFDGEEEGQGVLLGVVTPMALGYMTHSSKIEVGRPLGIKFPDRSKEDCVLISTDVAAIIVMAKAKVVVKNKVQH